MANDRITYSMLLDKVINGEALNDEYIEKAKALKVALVKKSTKPQGESKKAIENKAQAEVALAYLTENGTCTIAQMTKGVEGWSDYSGSKVSAIMKVLVDNGRVVKGKGKGGIVTYSPINE